MDNTTNPDVISLLKESKALVFDFDGTLVDSNEIKWEAFEKTFSQYPNQLNEIMEYCKSYNHTPRDKKFRHIYENILGLEYTPAINRSLLDQFEATTTPEIIAAPEISGAAAFLRGLSPKIITAVLSSTPHEVLVQILRERGWSDLFQHIRGAPIDKTNWLEQFREQFNLSQNQIIFFGDTLEDANAAQQANCSFIGIFNPAIKEVSPYWVDEFWPLIFGS